MAKIEKTSVKAGLKSFILILAIILLSEALVMALLHVMGWRDVWGVLLDPLLLSLIATPFLYHYIIRPLFKILEASEETERRLRETESRFRTVFESSTDAVMLLTTEHFIDCNEATLRMFACSREEFLSKHPGELSPPTQPDGKDSREAANEMIAIALREKRNFFSWTHRRTNGEDFPAEVLLSFLEIDGQTLIQATVRDITERRNAEAALRESERKYRALFESCPEGILIAEHGSRKFLYANPAICDLLGYSVSDFMSMSILDIHPKESHERAIAGFDSYALGEKSAPKPIPCLKRDGTIVMTEINTTVIMLDGKQVSIGFFRDITERRLHESILSARLRLTEYAADHSVRDLLQKVIDEVEILTESKVGFFHFVEPDQVNLSFQAWSTNTLQNMCKAQENEEHYSQDKAGVWADCLRERLPVIHNDYASLSHRKGLPEGRAPIDRELAVPVFWENKVVAILGVGNKLLEYDQRDVQTTSTMADLTWEIIARKKSEEQQHSLETQILQSQKLESLGVMAGGIAHDFNNILMTILGFTDMALEDVSQSSPARKSLLEIKVATKRAADLSRQMLAYCGQGSLSKNEIDLSKIIQEMSNLIGGSIPKNAVLQSKFNQSPSMVKADVGQIRQIVMNLVINASESIVEKTPPHGDDGLISISIGEKDFDSAFLSKSGVPGKKNAGKYVFLEVSDTGCGMDEETLKKMFDPFFTTKFSGRGLGLSAVFGIMREHGGAIIVESEKGKGTTFTVLFRPA